MFIFHFFKDIFTKLVFVNQASAKQIYLAWQQNHWPLPSS